jgi:hypothetical protein
MTGEAVRAILRRQTETIGEISPPNIRVEPTMHRFLRFGREFSKRKAGLLSYHRDFTHEPLVS